MALRLIQTNLADFVRKNDNAFNKNIADSGIVNMVC